jgi:TolA-binding protein
MNKTALYISIALTAFILVTIVGVGFAMKTQPQLGVAEVVGTVPVSDPALPKEIQEREARYQELINQANLRLDELQKENQSLQEQLNTAETQVQQPTAALEITPDQAIQVAANFLGDERVYSIEGTIVRGVALYKVTFSSGAVVYIGLDGQVVGSQAPIMASNSLNGSAQNVRGELEEPDEHEGGSDD